MKIAFSLTAKGLHSSLLMGEFSENPSLNPDAEGAHVRAVAPLPIWSMYNSTEEVNLDRLTAFDRVVVATENHRYEIIVIEPGTSDVLVRGGQFFPLFTRARLAGSSLGGSFLKPRTVKVGLRLEFTEPGGRSILTSRVSSVTVVPPVDGVASAEF